jgi:hypothetical protein
MASAMPPEIVVPAPFSSAVGIVWPIDPKTVNCFVGDAATGPDSSFRFVVVLVVVVAQ